MVQETFLYIDHYGFDLYPLCRGSMDVYLFAMVNESSTDDEWCSVETHLVCTKFFFYCFEHTLEINVLFVSSLHLYVSRNDLKKLS